MSQEAVLLALRWMFALAAVAAVVAYVVRPVLRMLRATPHPDLLTPDFSHLLEGEEMEIPNAEDEAGFDRNSALAQARADPRAAAIMVRAWLKQRR